MENNKLQLMVSYHGSFQFRSWDHELSYIGGVTKLISVGRDTSFSNFVAKLCATSNFDFGKIKFHLPGENLDFLVSIIDDDDLQQMIIEHDHLQWPARLRIFLFPRMSQGGYDLLGLTEDQIKTTDQVNSSLAASKALKLDGLVIVGGVTSNTDAAQLAETFAEANCSTKVVGVPVTLNGDLKNHFVETNVGFDTICKVNSQLISNVCTDALSAEKSLAPAPASGPFGSFFLAEEGILIPESSVQLEAQILSDGIRLSVDMPSHVPMPWSSLFQNFTNWSPRNDLQISFQNGEILYPSTGLQIIKNKDIEVLRELGSGPYGIISQGKWKCIDVVIKRTKEIDQGSLTEQFWQQVYTLSKLSHPNIVAFYGAVQDYPGGQMAIVTELMASYSLRNASVRSNWHVIDRSTKINIALQGACGMEYLHAQNIPHLDLKSNNFLLDLKVPTKPICKVGDFGLFNFKIKRYTDDAVGSLPWKAPELLNDSSNTDSKKVDVYSFGIVLWEIWTGADPYANMHDPDEIKECVISNNLRPTMPGDCGTEWKELMESCWAQEPADRPTFKEIVTLLRQMPKDI